jgi:L-seryl-tRNA(Ser) seleniumtransferase
MARPPVVLPAASTAAYNLLASVLRFRRGSRQAFVSDLFRSLPSVDRLLQDERLVALSQTEPRLALIDAVRATLADARQAIRDGEPAGNLIESVEARLARARRLPLRSVINATGVVIHTNLGRAPLSQAARAAMAEIADGYSNLEYDLEAGGRGSRHEHVTGLLRQLTGAEAALVVNNNASAVLLALSALAQGREVVVSRGELVEIGGGFRIPDVLRQSGCALVEVGTTNRTYVADYVGAKTDATAAFLRVHASNYRVIGFTHAPTLAELAAAAHADGLLLVDDLGSGTLLDTSRYGLMKEPLVQEAVAAGADLVCFSGDKLLGGPQAGIVVGRAEIVNRLKRHPLTRAVRPDKSTLAALGATLLHYVRGEAEREVPVWQMIAASPASLESRARAVIDALGRHGEGWRIVDGHSAVGGGSLPGETLPTRLLAAPVGRGAARLGSALRGLRPAVLGRIEQDRLVLDLRTVLPNQDATLAAQLREALTTNDAPDGQTSCVS